MTIKEKFYKPFRVSEKEENILFYGCLHNGHDPAWENPIWKMRGFNSAKECDEALINGWNKKSNYNTIGFLLGDTMFGYGGAERFLKLLDRLNFKELYLLGGNHVSGFHQALNLTDENGDYFLNSEKKVIFCPNYFEAYVNGQFICFSHYPILSFSGQGKGAWMCFSHVHGRLKDSEVGRAYLNSGAKVFEVSVEENSCPINFKELKAVMKNKKGASFDHH